MADNENAFKDAKKERKFQTWYKLWAGRLGINKDPDEPEHYYDYRGAYDAGAEPNEEGHWPSKFKRKGHPSYYLEGVDTTK